MQGGPKVLAKPYELKGSPFEDYRTSIETEGAGRSKAVTGEVTMQTSEATSAVDQSLGVQTDLDEGESTRVLNSAELPIGKQHVIRAILLHDISHVQAKGNKYLNLARLPKRELPFQNLGLKPQINDTERSTQAASSDCLSSGALNY